MWSNSEILAEQEVAAKGSNAVDVVEVAVAAAGVVDASKESSRENICPYLHHFHN